MFDLFGERGREREICESTSQGEQTGGSMSPQHRHHCTAPTAQDAPPSPATIAPPLSEGVMHGVRQRPPAVGTPLVTEFIKVKLFSFEGHVDGRDICNQGVGSVEIRFCEAVPIGANDVKKLKTELPVRKVG